MRSACRSMTTVLKHCMVPLGMRPYVIFFSSLYLHGQLALPSLYIVVSSPVGRPGLRRNTVIPCNESEQIHESRGGFRFRSKVRLHISSRRSVHGRA